MRRVVVVFVLILAGAPRTVVQAAPAAPAAPATDAGSLRADFNHDGFADLAVGVPQDQPGGLAGAVNVLYGSASGLSGSGSQYFTQNTPGVASSAETPDTFGAALAAGDFDHDGFADLAVGAPGEGVGDITFAGAVNVLYGSAGGLSGSGSGSQYFTQNTSGVASSAENNDRLGFSLAAGDFNHDGFADLAVGAPFEGLGSIIDAGAVILLYGLADGLSGASGPLLTQDTLGVANSAEAEDHFGYALAAGDFDQDGFADLAVGVRDEDVGDITFAGAVNVLYGSAGGFSGTGSQFFTQETPGVGGSAENNDLFGFALAASGS
jgi:hypothetical protein